MPTDSQDLKEHLLQTDPEFRELATVHRQLDDRLHALESKHYLTESEQLEEITIKKRKLHLKDRMEDIMRRYRHAESTTSRA
jgi:uncharacterized protein YdcH (DUF465 family)